MSEITTVLEYLLDLGQAEEVSNMTRLAAFTVLNKFLESDKDFEIQDYCLKKGIVSTLVMALDLGFSPNCDPADLLYVYVTMQTLWRFSVLPTHMIQPLISEIVSRRLLTYIDVKGDFFVFPSKLQHVLKENCENKQLIGKVKDIAMATEPLEYIHRHTKNELKRLPKLPYTMRVCSLFDTSQEEDRDVTQYILQQKLAWKDRVTFVGSYFNHTVSQCVNWVNCELGTAGTHDQWDVMSSDSDEWQDILVTKVIDGGFFWAQVGEETIKEVCSIQQHLNSGLQLERQHVSASGDLVIVCAEMIPGTKSLLRAQIICSANYVSRMTDVFLIDYGYILTIPETEIFIMPEYFKVFEQKISLCTLEGLQAPPKDEELTVIAAAILSNIAKQEFPYAGEMLCQLDGLAITERLLTTTDNIEIAGSLCCLLGNLGLSKKLDGEFMESRIIPLLLEKLSLYAREEGCSPTTDDLDTKKIAFAENCIVCLTNIMHRNSDSREKFYQCQGLDIVLEFLVKKVRIHTGLYYTALKLLKAFIGSAVMNKDQDLLQARPTLKGSTKSPRKSQDTISPVRAVKNDKETEVTVSSPSDYDQTPVNDRLVSQAATTQTPQSVDNPGHYVLGSCVYICDDQRHELHPASKVSNISSPVLAQIICGMLNSGRGGTIYCGIDKDGIVFGFELSRDEKDRFRLGVDQLMYGKLNPKLLHFNFDFNAVPVIDKIKQEMIPDLFVIEIHVRAARGVTYTTNDDQCFYRYGSATNTLTRQEIRKLVAVEEEELFRGEIERLMQRKQELLVAKTV